jgi:hypothetical protein
MKISELKSPYKELAELRRKQDGDDLELDTLCAAFRYTDTIEGGEFWASVTLGDYPCIPSESLKELKQSNMKDLIGKKVKGFKFEDTRSTEYAKLMDGYIGEIGEITQYDSSGTAWLVEFKDGESWYYPADQIEAHLVDEWVVGEEYEFNHGSDDAWVKRKLIAVLPENYNCNFIVQSGYDKNEHAFYSHIRPIPKENPIQKQIEKLEKELAELKQLTSK